MSEPREIHITGFLERVRALTEKSSDSSLLFLLGSGASRQSGIKTGGEMVADWLEMLRKEDPRHEAVAKDEWATAERIGIASFDRNDPATSYPKIFARAFDGRRKEGFDYLEAEIAGRTPSFGYSVLAQIVSSTKHKVVVTTNFDNLVIDALSIYTTATPLICGHESLAGFIRHRPTRPQVVKVHRDLFYAPRNTTDELSALPEEFAKAIAQLFTAHVPVVIGYGANDGSLMGVLNSLQPSDLPQGIYWCYWTGGPKPRQEVLELVARHNGWLVGIAGFDELMIRLQDALHLEPLDDFLKKRGDERAMNYKDRRDTLGRELTEAAKRATTMPRAASASPGGEQSAEALQALQAVMSRKQERRTETEWDSLAKLETDFTTRGHIYEDGLRALPESPWMHVYAARFFRDRTGMRSYADQLFRRAIALAPGNANILGNYAAFLHTTDPQAAYPIYKQAVEIDPTNEVNLANYGSWLSEVRGDHDAAETFFRRAVTNETTNPYVLVRYAVFLEHVRHDRRAADALFDRALTADPSNFSTLMELADVLLTTGREKTGQVMLKAALARVEAGSPREAECRFEMYCFEPADEGALSLRRLKKLIDDDIRVGNSDFSRIVARATARGHSDVEWLPKLEAVLTGRAESATLDSWRAWQEAGDGTGLTDDHAVQI